MKTKNKVIQQQKETTVLDSFTVFCLKCIKYKLEAECARKKLSPDFKQKETHVKLAAAY